MWASAFLAADSSTIARSTSVPSEMPTSSSACRGFSGEVSAKKTMKPPSARERAMPCPVAPAPTTAASPIGCTPPLGNYATRADGRSIDLAEVLMMLALHFVLATGNIEHFERPQIRIE